ncbi:MAG: SMC-Scp complex subunit ScpB [Proteobacteria bacterium]|nr:SMC-Scp complex subunit ScpB [Pseudomonadota bacterium]
MEGKPLKSIIESLIFVSGSPLRIDSIQELLENVDKKVIQSCLDELVEEYRQLDRGFHLVKVAEGFQFRTKPEYAHWIQQSKRTKPTRLTKAALETLAIVAYKQPIIRAEIETIRGVDSGWVIRALLEKQLIRIMGRKALPGRPIVYGTSKYFLEFFGLESISSLPTLREIQELGKGMEEINSQESV